MFTSGARLVNAHMYQMFLQMPIDSMIFCLDFVECQIHADHSQYVRNQNQWFQDISLDL